jgi:hypothetical protein
VARAAGAEAGASIGCESVRVRVIVAPATSAAATSRHATPIAIRGFPMVENIGTLGTRIDLAP